MEYNSAREELRIPEYGRNIQKLIQHAVATEDKEFRQALTERIIELMMQMHPQNRNVEDYRDKLWKHLYYISEFKIDVVPPSGKIPTPEGSLKRPEKVPYPVSEARFRHYGHNVQKMVKKAIEMEDGDKKEAFISVIASYMKLAYRLWNKEHYVSDEVVKGDLVALSNGELELKEDFAIDNLSNINKRRRRSNGSSKDRDHRDRDKDRDHKGRGRGRRKK